MPERVISHLVKLGVRFGEDHDLDMDAIKSLIRKCELARVPFSIRAGVFHVGEEALAAARDIEAEIDARVKAELDKVDAKLKKLAPAEPVED